MTIIGTLCFHSNSFLRFPVNPFNDPSRTAQPKRLVQFSLHGYLPLGPLAGVVHAAPGEPQEEADAT